MASFYDPYDTSLQNVTYIPLPQEPVMEPTNSIQQCNYYINYYWIHDQHKQGWVPHTIISRIRQESQVVPNNVRHFFLFHHRHTRKKVRPINIARLRRQAACGN